MTHVRIAARQDDIYAVRIAAGEADLILGCDLVVAAGDEALTRLNEKISHAVINSHESATAEFTRNPDAQVPGEAMRQALVEAVGADKTHFIDATRLATRLLGDSIATNLFMLGFAWQMGLVPVSAEAIEQAIELNGVSVELNRQAFRWGRRGAHRREASRRWCVRPSRPNRCAARSTRSSPGAWISSPVTRARAMPVATRRWSSACGRPTAVPTRR